jgi:hypothetical protein
LPEAPLLSAPPHGSRDRKASGHLVTSVMIATSLAAE